MSPLLLMLLMLLLVCTSALTCPKGAIQIGETNADIPGCGLESCDARYQNKYPTIEACQNGCISNSNCLSYSWAPMNGDRNHQGTTVCTLYNSDVPTNTWSPMQIMCKLNELTINPTIMPTIIPTNMPTYAPSFHPTYSNQYAKLSTVTSKNTNVTSFQTSEVDIVLLNTNSVQYSQVVHHHYMFHPMIYIIVGLIAVLVFILLCMCCLFVYCMKQRNLQNGMDEVNDSEEQSKCEGVNTTSKYNHTFQLSESVFNTINIDADEGEETVITKSSNNSNELLLNDDKQNFKLVAVDSDDESENGDWEKMYELPIGKTKRYCENNKQSIDSDVYDGDNTNLLLLEDVDNVVPM